MLGLNSLKVSYVPLVTEVSLLDVQQPEVVAVADRVRESMGDLPESLIRREVRERLYAALRKAILLAAALAA